MMRLVRDRKGATAVEYALLLALIAVAILGGLNAFASSSNGTFNGASAKVVTALNNGAPG